MNSIRNDQNNTCQLEQLAAMRQIYSFVKMVFNIQVILSVPVVIALSYLVSQNPSCKVYSALWSILVTLADLLILAHWQKHLKETAAKIQETFDCTVLQLEWNEYKCGVKPPKDTINEWLLKYYQKHKKDKLDNLKDWYLNGVGDIFNNLPLCVARVVCQRENCAWDAKLRRRYAVVIGVMITAVILILVVVAIRKNVTVEKLLLEFLLPCLPALVLAIRQVKEQIEAANRIDRLHKHCVSLWEKARTLSDDILLRESRDLQNEIFDHRKNSPLVLDTVYWLTKRSCATLTDKTSNDLVMEALGSQHALR